MLALEDWLTLALAVAILCPLGYGVSRLARRDLERSEARRARLPAEYQRYSIDSGTLVAGCFVSFGGCFVEAIVEDVRARADDMDREELERLVADLQRIHGRRAMRPLRALLQPA